LILIRQLIFKIYTRFKASIIYKYTIINYGKPTFIDLLIFY